MISYDPDLKIFSSSLINDDHFFTGFATRELGSARNFINILKFFRENSIAFKTIAVLSQIHSTNISFYQESSYPDKLFKVEDTDGIITNKTGVVLVIRNADCLPLIYCDKSKGIVGISHEGWRGSLKKMAIKMLNRFISLGSKAENIICSIGPAIGSCCYDIDDDRYYSFLEEFDGYSDKVFFKKKGRWHLSLTLLNYLQLIEAGVKKENIDFFPFCTKCDDKRFFSRRRTGRKIFEEMFNFVMIN